jgi:AraC-like DNA-binding protein
VSWTDRPEITWIESGGATWTLRGRRHEVRAGDVVYVPPDDVHVGRDTAPASDVHVLWVPVVESSALLAPAVISGRGALARQLFRALDTRGETLAAETAMTLLFAMAEPLALVGAEPRGVRRMRDRLHADPRDPPSLAELAELAGLGRFEALRAFTRAMGISPHAYLREIRLTHAQALLRAGASCAQAAHVAGFADEAHFSRWHRRRHGVPPGVYARAFR